MADARDAVLSQLRATHAGEPWYGSSRATILAGLTPADAAARPIAGAHSIWELVLHMTAWTREVTRRIGGAAAAEPAEGDWPPVRETTGAAWRAALDALDRASAELLAATEALPPERWGARVGDQRDPPLGTGVTIGETIVGIAQHDAYHSAQLSLLRRALASRG
jgi:uncharacterized damage-inducible protein DinB